MNLNLTLFILGSLKWSMPKIMEGEGWSPMTSWYCRVSTFWPEAKTPVRLMAPAQTLAKLLLILKVETSGNLFQAEAFFVSVSIII